MGKKGLHAASVWLIKYMEGDTPMSTEPFTYSRTDKLSERAYVPVAGGTELGQTAHGL